MYWSKITPNLIGTKLYPITLALKIKIKNYTSKPVGKKFFSTHHVAIDKTIHMYF